MDFDDNTLSKILSYAPGESKASLRQTNKALRKELLMSELFNKLKHNVKRINRKGQVIVDMRIPINSVNSISIEVLSGNNRHVYTFDWQVVSDNKIAIDMLRYVKGIYNKNLGLYAPVYLAGVEYVSDGTYVMYEDNKKVSTLQSIGGIGLLTALMYYVDHHFKEFTVLYDKTVAKLVYENAKW